MCSTHLETSIVAPALNGEGEGVAPGSDLLLKLLDAGNIAGGDLGLEVLLLVGLLGERSLDLLGELDGLIDVGGNLLEVGLAEATGGHSGGTNTETTGGKGALVTGNGVLVAGDVDLLKDELNTGTIDTNGAEVNEDHVGVSAVRDELVAELLELLLESLGVGNDLLLVLLELGGGSLLEGNGKSGDGVVVGATLVTREDGEVDLVLKVIEGLLAGLGVDRADTAAEEDHGATGATEGLVSGGGDDIGVEEGRGDDLGGNEAGNVSNIDNEVSANGVGNLAHALVVNQTAVGRGTGDEDLGAEELGVLLEGIVVNDAGVDVDAVGHGLEVGRDSRDPELIRGLAWPL